MNDKREERTVASRPGERHPLDLFSLIAGVVFLGVGLVFVINETADANVDVGWVVAALLIGLGLAGALGSLVRPRRRQRDTAPGVDTEVQEAGDREEIDQ